MSADKQTTPWHDMLRRFWSSPVSRVGAAGIVLIVFPALFAPFIANGKPLFFIDVHGRVSMPFLRFFFAPESSESLVEMLFNFASVMLVAGALIFLLCRRKTVRLVAVTFTAVVMLAGFILTPQVMDKTDFRRLAEDSQCAVFAPIPYGPDEIVGIPYAPPGGEHILGCDDIGRDLASRLIYGARVSLAVGILAAALALVIGVTVGMCAGYFRGVLDLLLMRLVEIISCFPMFLLLLILMSMLGDYKIAQSIPLVIAVIGLTGWIGLAFLVRGEVLKESSLPYVQSCVISGVPGWRIMFRHLLPNITAPVLISCTFGVAGAIMSESGLSFLGFGVQPPTASWGNLLRQAFDNPLEYWHLTFFPGVVLFIRVMSFNFTGEGLRRAFDVKEM